MNVSKRVEDPLLKVIVNKEQFFQSDNMFRNIVVPKLGRFSQCALHVLCCRYVAQMIKSEGNESHEGNKGHGGKGVPLGDAGCGKIMRYNILFVIMDRVYDSFMPLNDAKRAGILSKKGSQCMNKLWSVCFVEGLLQVREVKDQVAASLLGTLVNKIDNEAGMCCAAPR